MSDPEVKIKIGADAAGAESAFKNLGVTVFTWGQNLKMAGEAAAAAFKVIVTDAIHAAEAVDKLNKQTGISTDFIQKLGFAAEQEHASFESAAAGMKLLTRNLGQAQAGSEEMVAAFQKLGFSVQQVKKLKPEEAFLALTKVMADQTIPQTEKMALAMKVMGRSAAELLPLLKQIGEVGLESMAQFGHVMSENAVRSLERFGDTMTSVEQAVEGFRNTLAEHFVPILNRVSEWMETNGPAIAKQWTENIGAAMDEVVVVAEHLWNALTPVYETLMGIAKDFAEDFGNLFGTFKTGATDADILKNVIDGIGSVLETVGVWIGEVIAGFQLLARIYGQFAGLQTNLISTMWEAMKRPWDASSLLSSLKSDFQIFVSGVQAEVTNYNEKIAKLNLGAQNEEGIRAQNAAKEKLRIQEEGHKKEIEEQERHNKEMLESQSKLYSELVDEGEQWAEDMANALHDAFAEQAADDEWVRKIEAMGQQYTDAFNEGVRQGEIDMEDVLRGPDPHAQDAEIEANRHAQDAEIEANRQKYLALYTDAAKGESKVTDAYKDALSEREQADASYDSSRRKRQSDFWTWKEAGEKKAAKAAEKPSDPWTKDLQAMLDKEEAAYRARHNGMTEAQVVAADIKKHNQEIAAAAAKKKLDEENAAAMQRARDDEKKDAEEKAAADRSAEENARKMVEQAEQAARGIQAGYKGAEKAKDDFVDDVQARMPSATHALSGTRHAAEGLANAMSTISHSGGALFSPRRGMGGLGISQETSGTNQAVLDSIRLSKQGMGANTGSTGGQAGIPQAAAEAAGNAAAIARAAGGSVEAQVNAAKMAASAVKSGGSGGINAPGSNIDASGSTVRVDGKGMAGSGMFSGQAGWAQVKTDAANPYGRIPSAMEQRSHWTPIPGWVWPDWAKSPVPEFLAAQGPPRVGADGKGQGPLAGLVINNRADATAIAIAGAGGAETMALASSGAGRGDRPGYTTPGLVFQTRGRKGAYGAAKGQVRLRPWGDVNIDADKVTITPKTETVFDIDKYRGGLATTGMVKKISDMLSGSKTTADGQTALRVTDPATKDVASALQELLRNANKPVALTIQVSNEFGAMKLTGEYDVKALAQDIGRFTASAIRTAAVKSLAA